MVAPHPCQHLIVLDFLILAILLGALVLQVILIYDLLKLPVTLVIWGNFCIFFCDPSFPVLVVFLILLLFTGHVYTQRMKARGWEMAQWVNCSLWRPQGLSLNPQKFCTAGHSSTSTPTVTWELAVQRSWHTAEDEAPHPRLSSACTCLNAYPFIVHTEHTGGEPW